MPINLGREEYSEFRRRMYRIDVPLLAAAIGIFFLTLPLLGGIPNLLLVLFALLMVGSALRKRMFIMGEAAFVLAFLNVHEYLVTTHLALMFVTLVLLCASAFIYKKFELKVALSCRKL